MEQDCERSVPVLSPRFRRAHQREQRKRIAEWIIGAVRDEDEEEEEEEGEEEEEEKQWGAGDS